MAFCIRTKEVHNMLRITRAVLSDAQTIRKLEAEIWEEEVTSKYDIAAIVHDGHCFVGKDGPLVVGAIVGIHRREGGIAVLDIIVRKLRRMSGVGTKLYQKLLEDAKFEKVHALVDPDNIGSIRFHTKLGAKNCGLVKNPYALQESDDEAHDRLRFEFN